MSTCSGTPISWLELERFHLQESSQAAITRAHISECADCARALRSIAEDTREMPALVPARPKEESRWHRFWQRAWWTLPLAAATALLVVVIALPSTTNTTRDRYTGSKGDDFDFVLLREHAGELLRPDEFAPGDRFRIKLSCEGRKFVDVVVSQPEGKSYPFATQEVDCGNGQLLPGAFHLDGGEADICVIVGTTRPERESLAPGAKCTKLRVAGE